MKKFLILILALVLCIAMLASCSLFNKEEPTEAPSEEQPETPAMTDEEAVAQAVVILRDKYKKLLDNNVTYGSFEVVAQVMIAGKAYPVAWTSNNENVTITAKEGDANTMIVNVPMKQITTAFDYEITATVTSGEQTKTLTLKLKKPEYNVITFEEYMAAEKGATVTIEGIVVGVNSIDQGNKRNHIFLVDASGEGGYYSYQMDKDPVKDLGIEIGMTVSVTGGVEPYSGMQEIKGGSAIIIDPTVKEVNPVDLTEVFANATSKTSFANYAGMLVTVKGVEIGAQALEKDTDQYLYFTIGNVKSYVRTYVTDMAFGASEDDKEAAKTTIDEAHAAKFGWTANVTGIVVLYSGNPYFIPVSTDCFEYVEFVEKTPAVKVETEKNALTFAEKITSETTLTLPAVGQYYSEVAITWTLDGEAVTGSTKLTPVVGETNTVTLVATITCGDVTETKTFEITLSMDPISINEVLASEDGTAVIVEGIVISIQEPWSDYKNMSYTIRDGEGNTLYIFRSNTQVELGDAVQIIGEVGSYNGSKQIAKNSTATITGHYTEMTLEQATAAADGTLVIIKGTVSDIAEGDTWSDKYQNMSFTITDDAGNTLYIYRCGTKVVVGDVVTITGTVGSYKEAKQIAQGSKAIVEKAEGGEEISGTVTPATDIAVETPYVLTSNNKDGAVYISGGVESGRLSGSASLSGATYLYLEAGETAGQYYIYYLNGTTKQYISAKENKAAGIQILTEKDDTCLWTIDATAKTIISVTVSNRGLATQTTGTFTTFSLYATSNFGTADYCVAWFATVSE